MRGNSRFIEYLKVGTDVITLEIRLVEAITESCLEPSNKWLQPGDWDEVYQVLNNAARDHLSPTRGYSSYYGKSKVVHCKSTRVAFQFKKCSASYQKLLEPFECDYDNPEDALSSSDNAWLSVTPHTDMLVASVIPNRPTAANLTDTCTFSFSTPYNKVSLNKKSLFIDSCDNSKTQERNNSQVIPDSDEDRIRCKYEADEEDMFRYDDDSQCAQKWDDEYPSPCPLSPKPSLNSEEQSEEAIRPYKSSGDTSQELDYKDMNRLDNNSQQCNVDSPLIHKPLLNNKIHSHKTIRPYYKSSEETSPDLDYKDKSQQKDVNSPSISPFIRNPSLKNKKHSRKTIRPYILYSGIPSQDLDDKDKKRLNKNSLQGNEDSQTLRPPSPKPPLDYEKQSDKIIRPCKSSEETSQELDHYFNSLDDNTQQRDEDSQLLSPPSPKPPFDYEKSDKTIQPSTSSEKAAKELDYDFNSLENKPQQWDEESQSSIYQPLSNYDDHSHKTITPYKSSEEPPQELNDTDCSQDSDIDGDKPASCKSEDDFSSDEAERSYSQEDFESRIFLPNKASTSASDSPILPSSSNDMASINLDTESDSDSGCNYIDILKNVGNQGNVKKTERKPAASSATDSACLAKSNAPPLDVHPIFKRQSTHRKGSGVNKRRKLFEGNNEDIRVDIQKLKKKRVSKPRKKSATIEDDQVKRRITEYFCKIEEKASLRFANTNGHKELPEEKKLTRVLKPANLNSSESDKNLKIDDKVIVVDDATDDDESVTSYDLRHLSLEDLEIAFVRNKTYLHKLFKGKFECNRHEQYKKGGAARRELNYSFATLPFDHSQQEHMCNLIMKKFCNNSLTFLDYVLKVLLPELATKIFMDRNDLNHEDALNKICEVYTAAAEKM